MAKNFKQELLKTLLIVFAIAIDTIGVFYFLLPYNFPCGGITGIARVINHFSGLSVSTGVAILSLVMFLLGLFLVGKSFAMKTLVASIAYPAFLKLYEAFPTDRFMLEDRMIAAIYSGLFMGVGLGLCVRMGSSTGGTDLLGVIGNKYFKIPVATVTYIVDTVVLGMQMLFGNFEDILFGLFVILVTSIVMNAVITLGGNNVQMLVISPKNAVINAELQKHGGYGTTLLHGKTGRFGDETEVVLCTVSAKSVSRIKDIIYDVDDTAFVTMTNVSEVYGRGFSMDRVFRDTRSEWLKAND